MLINEKQAAELLGLSAATLRIQRSIGERPGGLPLIPYVKLGRSVRYDSDELQSLVDAHRVARQ